ncbi:hypothetical protein Tco_0566841 [Tanacetum coccineum]
MEISIADQIALDDALVAPADRLKIGKCNLRLSSDVTSKEATLQVVYDVLKLTPFYKAFQVTADAPEIYMQEFWASAYVHNRSVRFKMNNKKHIIGLDQFRDILQICPKVGNKKFVEPPLEKEILEHAEYDESNTYVLERFNTTAGNPVKKILLKLNLSDHRLIKMVVEVPDFRYSDTTHLSQSVEVLKLKNFKKDATLKLSKSTNQERYEHVGPEVASSQDGKVSRWRRDCAWLMISRCSRSQCQIQVQGTSSIQKSMITTTYSQEKVKRTS